MPLRLLSPAPAATLDPASVEEIVAQALAGENRAYATLYERFAKVVHGILLARVGPVEADDLTQEVFIQAMRKLSQLENPAAFGAWISTIARHRAMDFYRERRPTEALPEATSHDPPRAEAAQALAALQALPEAYREPLTLRLVEGLTGPEIAARTGLTPGSVRVNLHRGMKLLRQQLGLTPEGGTP